MTHMPTWQGLVQAHLMPAQWDLPVGNRSTSLDAAPVDRRRTGRGQNPSPKKLDSRNVVGRRSPLFLRLIVFGCQDETVPRLFSARSVTLSTEKVFHYRALRSSRFRSAMRHDSGDSYIRLRLQEASLPPRYPLSHGIQNRRRFCSATGDVEPPYSTCRTYHHAT